MKSFILFIALVLFNLNAFSQTNYSAETLEKIKEVENNVNGSLILNNAKPATIAERMAKYKVNGMSIAVIHDYKIAWAKGYGWADKKEKKPVTTETLFEPGSISKTLNALGILKLAQDKKVDLNADINDYLTTWKFPYDSLSKGKKITLAHLLSHTGGLSTHGFPGHNINGPIPTIVEVLDGKTPAVTPAVRSLFEPGLKFQYSGGGTTISQLLLMDITGAKYEDWMYENVLKPVGMVHSTYAQPPSQEMQRLCASAYRSNGTPIKNKFHVYPEQAAAGLWMTPTDLCNYIIDMQLAYKGQPSKVLSPEMVKLHLTPVDNGPSAMGTFIEDKDGSKYFSHSAGNDGFCGHFIANLEDGYGLVVFLNSDDWKLTAEIINSVAKAYNWKNYFVEPKKKNSIKVSKQILKKYEGIYLYESQLARILNKDGKLYLYTGGIYSEMHFTTPINFFNEEFSSVKEFIKDSKGNVTGYTRFVESKEYPPAIKISNPDTLHLENGVLSSMAWHLMENKNYKEAVAYFNRATELYPEDLNTKINLAHAYLYGDDYNKAISIYKTHMKMEVRTGYSWEDLLIEDYKYFRDKGYGVKVFDKVFKELGMLKP